MSNEPNKPSLLAALGYVAAVVVVALAVALGVYLSKPSDAPAGVTLNPPTLEPVPTQTVTAPPETTTVTLPPVTETLRPLEPKVDPCVEGNVDPSTWDTADDVYQFDSPDAQIVDIRDGQHVCFDQITFVVESPTDVGYSVSYADGAVKGQGSGLDQPVAGGAALNVVINADVPVPDLFNGYDVSPNMPALKQVKYLSHFEGKTQFAVGVDHRTAIAAEHFRSGDNMLVVLYIAHD